MAVLPVELTSSAALPAPEKKKRPAVLDTEHAFAVTLLLFNSVFWALLSNVIFRDPRYGLIWALSPLMCTTGAVTGRNRSKRTLALGINLFQVGIFQFLEAALTPLLEVRIVLFWIIFLLASQRRNTINTSVVMVGFLSGFWNESYLSGLDILLGLGVTAALILPTYYLLDGALLGDWDGIDTPPRFSSGAVFRHLVAFTMAFLLDYCTRMTYGSWISTTVGLCYMSGMSGRTARRTAMLRFLVAIPGLALGIMYLSAFSYVDYAVSYSVIFWGIIGYFLRYRTGQFELFYIPFVMMLCSAHNLAYASSPMFGNGWNYFLESVACIGIGSLCVLFAESEL